MHFTGLCCHLKMQIFSKINLAVMVLLDALKFRTLVACKNIQDNRSSLIPILANILLITTILFEKKKNKVFEILEKFTILCIALFYILPLETHSQ